MGNNNARLGEGFQSPGCAKRTRYNHNTNDGEPPYGRDRLNIAVSSDGKRGSAVVELRQAKESWEYPAVIQTTDDLIHISCTFSRRLIKHLVLNPAELA